MSDIKKLYEEDDELLYLIEDSSEEANELIYKKYSDAISYYAKKYAPLVSGKGIEEADLYQEGMIGLHDALENFKHQKDIKFSTFAFICIRRKIITALRNASRKKHSILNESLSLDYKTDDYASIDNSLYVASESIEDLLISKEKSDVFKSYIKKDLSFFEQSVYELKLNGFSTDEIASMLGKSYKSVESALSRIRTKLKGILNKID
ncbi:MAG: sigma-70 family RNA polymerase sigma factor [Tenericutes bacterium]|nr:sigma-70 family RNA polymerase sigma factor [Mycoplasmatota bacterium]